MEGGREIIDATANSKREQDVRASSRKHKSSTIRRYDKPRHWETTKNPALHYSPFPRLPTNPIAQIISLGKTGDEIWENEGSVVAVSTPLSVRTIYKRACLFTEMSTAP